MTLDSGILAGQLRGMFFRQGLSEPGTGADHSSHRTPVGEIAHEAFQNKSLTVNINGDLGSRLQVEPLTDGLWYCNLAL